MRTRTLFSISLASSLFTQMTLSRPFTGGQIGMSARAAQQSGSMLTIVSPQHGCLALLDFPNQNFHLGVPLGKVDKRLTDEGPARIAISTF